MPVSSDTVIANLALSAIGNRTTIQSMTEPSAEAQQVSLHYTNVRDELLRSAHWNFARKQVTAALVNDSTQLIPVVTTNSSFASGALQITVTNGIGITPGVAVAGSGIAPGTTATTVSGNFIGLSAATTSAQSGVSLIFTSSVYQPVPVPWTYEYAYPSDCVQIREIIPIIPTQQINQAIFGFPNNGTVNNAGTFNNFAALNTNPVIKFIVTTDVINGQNQTVFLTNQPATMIVYTYQCVNPSLFDPSFVYAFAGKLASRICIALSGDKGLAKMALEEAESIITQAKARDGNEGITTVDRVPDWIRARGFAWSWQFPEGPWQMTGNMGYWGF